MSKEDERSGEELALIRKRLKQAARWSEGGPVPAEPSAPPQESTDGAAAAEKPRKRGSRKKAAVEAAADTAVLSAEGAEPERRAEPEKAADAESEAKADTGKKAKPVRRRRTAKGEKAMEEKPVKTETVSGKPEESAAEPAAVTEKSAEPAAVTEKPAELSEAAEPVPAELSGPESADGNGEPSEMEEKPGEAAEPSEAPEPPEDAVPAFAPASEEAFQEILEEERKETERQEEEDREAPRKAHGFLAKLADKKLPPWLAKIVDRLQKMELPEKVNLPRWFGPINKLNLPNQLTLLRIVLIPIMMGILYWGFPGSRYVALLVFIAASVTDMLDGRIARKYNLVTDFGKFADPLADKMLVTAAMLWFVATGHMPAWALLIVVCREFAVSGLRMMASGKGRVIAAGWSGKVKTAATMVCLILMFFPIPALLNTICVWVITLTTLYSGVEYFLLNKDVIASI